MLFNRSFANGVLPSAWKDALVVPVYKRGDRSQLTNYRPISLLSTVGKVCERVVYNKLYRFRTSILSDHQSGFRKKDATVMHLTRLVQLWSEALDHSEYVGIVFFDLRKAFDRVWHKGLLAKLDAAGIRGQAFRWFASYLSSRRQRTKVGDAISSYANITAGVPQDAILSPLLFILYVNDITKVSSASVNLFSDDTSSFVSDASPASLSLHLQDTVYSLSLWFKKWLLSVNIQKSAVLVLRSKSVKSIDLQISLDGSLLPQVDTHKHLGVTLNSTLTWDDRVQTIVTKASQRIGLLRRYRKRLPALSVRQLHCSSVRPVIEHGRYTYVQVNAGP